MASSRQPFASTSNYSPQPVASSSKHTLDSDPSPSKPLRPPIASTSTPTILPPAASTSRPGLRELTSGQAAHCHLQHKRQAQRNPRELPELYTTLARQLSCSIALIKRTIDAQLAPHERRAWPVPGFPPPAEEMVVLGVLPPPPKLVNVMVDPWIIPARVPPPDVPRDGPPPPLVHEALRQARDASLHGAPPVQAQPAGPQPQPQGSAGVRVQGHVHVHPQAKGRRTAGQGKRDKGKGNEKQSIVAQARGRKDIPRPTMPKGRKMAGQGKQPKVAGTQAQARKWKPTMKVWVEVPTRVELALLRAKGRDISDADRLKRTLDGSPRRSTRKSRPTEKGRYRKTNAKQKHISFAEAEPSGTDEGFFSGFSGPEAAPDASMRPEASGPSTLTAAELLDKLGLQRIIPIMAQYGFRTSGHVRQLRDWSKETRSQFCSWIMSLGKVTPMELGIFLEWIVQEQNRAGGVSSSSR